MSALITGVEYDVVPNLGGKIIKFKFTGAAASDWVVFDEPIGACYATLLDGSQNTVAYATGLLHTAGITATSTSLIYDTVTAATELPATEGYIMIANEIIKYTAGGAGTTGTLTGLKRGCFGTTAATASDGDTFYILNTLIFANGTTGLVRGIADVIGE